MGTNYYLKSKPCVTCGHSENKKHIGKSSFGWQFHFRGYREDMLVSYKSWLEELNDPNKIIVDEYNDQIPLDDFKQLIESKDQGVNHFNIISNNPMTYKERQYLIRHPYRYDSYHQNCWKDDEGYAFTDCEFC